MLARVFFFLIGFGLTVIGSVYIISYLNLFSIGYNFLEYVNFIIRKFECLCAFFGFLIMFLVVMIPGGNYNELHL
ncbi:MAG: hypothetical protein E7173_01760 [Firmicutes bacterium]|nr:hypothetical protein [Bacillota bacterium]